MQRANDRRVLPGLIMKKETILVIISFMIFIFFITLTVSSCVEHEDNLKTITNIEALRRGKEIPFKPMH